ncbi:hypothetical protein [Chlorogloeopsis fritschii]|uniref:hypothetical protein n=1 Tax=Chlorogloeopsis fritschii TaxID=1124 RepID=UPI00370D357F
MNHFERINDYEGQEDAENEEDTGTRERGTRGVFLVIFPPLPLTPSPTPLRL